VTVTFHKSSDTFPPRTMKSMTVQAGWTESDLIRLALLKSDRDAKGRNERGKSTGAAPTFASRTAGKVVARAIYLRARWRSGTTIDCTPAGQLKFRCDPEHDPHLRRGKVKE
jgi:hypothetical protein